MGKNPIRSALLGRRAVLAGAGLALGATKARAAQPLKVGKGGQNAFSFSLLDLGIREGIFARHGLDVESIEFAGGTRTQQALASGSIDIGLAGGTDLAAISHGAPVKAIAAMGGPPLDFAITVRADGPIKDVAGLRGGRVGVTTLSSLTAWLTQQAARHEGWGPDGIVRVAAGSGATAWALLRTGQVEGVAGDLGSALQAEQRGDGRVVVRFGQVVPHFQTFVIYAPDAVLRARPDAVRAFLAGWFETVAFAAAREAETVRVMAAQLGLDPAIVARLRTELLPMFSRDGHFDSQNMEALGVALREQVGQSINPASVTEAYLPH